MCLLLFFLISRVNKLQKLLTAPYLRFSIYIFNSRDDFLFFLLLHTRVSLYFRRSFPSVPPVYTFKLVLFMGALISYFRLFIYILYFHDCFLYYFLRWQSSCACSPPSFSFFKSISLSYLCLWHLSFVSFICIFYSCNSFPHCFMF